VVGVGSGGTIGGLSRYFARAIPQCEMVLADPEGSVLADYVKTGTMGKAGSWVVEGIGEDFLPPNADLTRVKKAYTISDKESLETARLLLKKAGILAGSSSGTLIAAALRYCREQTSPKRVCTFVCDSGNKYLSKQFNDFWMADQGFLPRQAHGDLRDVITRRYADRAVVTLAPSDTLLVAYGRMKLYEVSQIPVLEGSKVVGMIDESDLLLAAIDDETRLRQSVRDFMSTRLQTVDVRTPVRELLPLLDKGFVPIVVDGEEFIGLITRIDLLNHLRRKLR
jgi:cystathionine beta-synthase